MRSNPDNIRRLTNFRDLKDAIYFYTDTDKSSLNDFVYKLSIQDLITQLNLHLNSGNNGGGNLTLQQVTDNGNTTTNDVFANTLNTANAKLWGDGTIEGVTFQFLNSLGSLQSTATTNRAWQLPDKSGIIALLDDTLNIYNSDGVLTDTRTITFDNKQLYFNGTTGSFETRFVKPGYDLTTTNSSEIYQVNLDVTGLSRSISSVLNENGIFNSFGESGLSINLSISNAGFTVNDTLLNRGIIGLQDYSANYDDLTYVQKKYVDSKVVTDKLESHTDIAGITPDLDTVIIVNTFSTLTNSETTIDLALYEAGGRKFTFKHRDISNTNKTTLFSSNGTLFDDATNIELTTHNETVTIVFDGWLWLII